MACLWQEKIVGLSSKTVLYRDKNRIKRKNIFGKVKWR